MTKGVFTTCTHYGFPPLAVSSQMKPEGLSFMYRMTAKLLHVSGVRIPIIGKEAFPWGWVWASDELPLVEPWESCAQPVPVAQIKSC